MTPTNLSPEVIKALAQSQLFYVIKTDMQGLYTYTNSIFNETFQHISTNFIGQHTHNSIHGEDQAECLRAVLACCSQPGKPISTILRKPHPEGTFFYTNWEFTALTDETGQPVEILCIGYNISNEKRKQQKLQQVAHKASHSLEKLQFTNASLEKANNHLDRLLYIISHDLRSPISSALGLIEIMQKQENVNTIHNLLQTQEKSLQKLDMFVLNILDYSRNNRKPIIGTEISWESLVKISLDLHQASEFLEVTCDISQEGAFFSDKMRMSIMLNNLISNALKFRNPQLSESQLSIHIAADAQCAEISIQDNGIGIKDLYKTQIYDMFFRGHEQVPGSGLGLYIVKEIIDKLNGEISCESTYGEGTRFYIKLPNLVKDNHSANTNMIY